MRNFLVFFIIALVVTKANAQAWQADATPLHRAQKAITDVAVHDIISPPVAARIYAYASIAAYEVISKQNPKCPTLFGQIKGFPNIPTPIKKISVSVASVYATLLIGRQLLFSESIMDDSTKNILGWYKKKKIDATVYNNSLAYGMQVADSIKKWMAKDNYKETRTLKRYNFLKQEGKWIPTPPGYIAAVEPYWNRIRTIALDSANQFPPTPPPTFGKQPSDSFYKEANEVYVTGKNLTDSQRVIALYWDCNPFYLNTDGHLNFATKKISPGGHWMSITAQVCKQNNANIYKSAIAYFLVSVALHDAFISCWDEKYKSNLIRPETYIDNYIDESWRPLLQTPPFPEYTSGHSVISTASATILKHLFGDIPFSDNTEVEFGLLKRHFSSFTSACNEASISRLYGGIHYQASITNGQDEGKKVGLWVLKKFSSL